MVDLINILGTEYTVSVRSEKDDEVLKKCDGYCDYTTKEIVIRDISEDERDPDDVKDIEVYTRKVLRHEIIHAFFFESGLGVCSSYAYNDELVDWIAYQLPKMAKLFEELQIL